MISYSQSCIMVFSLVQTQSGSGCQERCIRKNYEAIPGLNRKEVCDGWEVALQAQDAWGWWLTHGPGIYGSWFSVSEVVYLTW